MMTYRYLLAYATSTGKEQIIGSTIVTLNKPIKTSADIDEITENLKKDFQADKVILLSFSKLGF